MKNQSIKNGVVVGDSMELIEAILFYFILFFVRINPCDPHHKIGEVLFTDSSFLF